MISVEPALVASVSQVVTRKWPTSPCSRHPGPLSQWPILLAPTDHSITTTDAWESKVRDNECLNLTLNKLASRVSGCWFIDSSVKSSRGWNTAGWAAKASFDRRCHHHDHALNQEPVTHEPRLIINRAKELHVSVIQQGLLAISDQVCIISESVVLDLLNVLSNQALASTPNIILNSWSSIPCWLQCLYIPRYLF